MLQRESTVTSAYVYPDSLVLQGLPVIEACITSSVGTAYRNGPVGSSLVLVPIGGLLNSLELTSSI